jgi:DNA polymerase V
MDNDEQQKLGFPSPALDYAETSLNLHQLMVRHPEATYFMRVEGNGMCSAGIFPGDLLVVDRAIDPRPGDVVIAVVDGIFVVRRFIRDTSGPRLMAETSEAMENSGEIVVWGVATHSIHTPSQRRIV